MTDLHQTGQKDDFIDVTMANLSLGPPGSCSDQSGYCKCRRNFPGRHFEKRPAAYPDFWRKTLFNKILEHKTKFNKKKLTYEILKPSKLQFINSSQTGVHSICKNHFTSTITVSSIGDVSEQNIPIKPSLSLPDINSLQTQSQTELKQTITKTRSSTELARLNSLQIWVKKSPKWKSRAKLNLKECRLFPLPTILEDTGEGQVDLGSLKNLSLSTQTPTLNVNALQSCSQQALTESGNNGPCDDITIDELASYLDLLVHIPKKMSAMAEMMYT